MRWTLAVLLLCAMSVSSAWAETAAGLQWKAPQGWAAQPAQPMRAATYTVRATAGDTAAAECAVYFFGAGQGGSVDANIERWKSQFAAPGGKPAAATVSTRSSHGLKITVVDTSGDYSGMGGPMAAQQRSVAGYRLLGAIVESPGGNVFVKFTGPMKTIAAHRAAFDQLLASFQPAK